jgi:D-alanyl-D-alanine carboxypeptidase
LFGLAAIIGFVAVGCDPADARTRRKRGAHKPAWAQNYKPPYAALVVDVNSGHVLHATNADARRHPASLTKIMTLYLLFERLDAGRLKLNSELKVSEHAAAQAPTKLGLKPGDTVSVEDAIKAMVTRSANDVAVVIAENLAGSEDSFAQMMTRKARALGMNRTVYRNASGLPDDDQVTTARDQAILGRAVQERFPRYYRYFSTRSFVYRGNAIRNHNRLLGSIDGVDGIKTGFTRASGFNLVTSVRRGNRHIVAVVLGGSSAGQRDARMRDLIGDTIAQASTKRTAPMIAEAVERQHIANPDPKAAAASRYAIAGMGGPFQLSLSGSRQEHAGPPLPPAAPRVAPVAGSTEPIRPVMVRTLSVKSRSVHTASADAVALPRVVLESDPSGDVSPPERARAEAPVPVHSATGALPEPATARKPVSLPKPPIRSGWIIQVGAYPDEEEAIQRLAAVKSKASRLLAGADPFTETVLKDDKTYYRARFAGFDKHRAEAACKHLKRNDIECITVRN